MGDVNVDIDFRVGKIGPIDSTVKSINSSIRSMFTSTQKLNSAIKETVADYKDTKSAIAEQKQLVSELASELERLQSEHGQFALTEKYKQLNDILIQNSEATKELRENLKDVTGILADTPAGLQALQNYANVNPNQTVDFRGEILDIDDAISTLQNLQNVSNNVRDSMDRLRQQGKAFEIVDNSAEIESTSAALDEEVDSLAQLNAEASKTKASLKGMFPVAFFKNLSLKNIIDQMKKLRNESRKTKSATEQLGSGFKTMLKYAFGVRSMYFLVRKLRSAIIDAYKTMAQMNGGSNSINTALSSLVSSLTYLRNAWAAAFSPILTYVAPVLSKLADMLASVGNTVAHFMAVLTGQKVVVQATKANINYAQSLDKSSGSAGKSAKANKKNAKSLQDYLNPLDEISKFNKENDSNSGAGGGGGIGGGGGGLTPDQQFTEVKANNEWAERLKKAWAEGAESVYSFFYDVGRICGNKLRDGLDKIPWDSIKVSAKKVAYGIAGFINGFVETPGLWQSIGTTLAEGINTALVFLNSLMTKIHWDSIGKGLATGLQTAFRKIDWKSVGAFISNVMIAGLNLIRGFIDGIDWKQLPHDVWKAIKDVFTGFKWGKLVSAGVGVVGALIGGISVALGEIGNTIKTKVVDPFIDKLKTKFKSGGIKEVGKYIWDGIKNGFINAVTKVGTWIKKNVFDPFIKAVKKPFGIASPAKNKKVTDIGKFIWEGILNGMKDAIKNIGTWVKEHIFDKFTNTLKNPPKFNLDLAKSLVFKLGDTMSNLKDKVFGKIKDIFGSGGSSKSEVRMNVGITSSISESLLNVLSSSGEVNKKLNIKAGTIDNTISNIFSSISDTITTTINVVSNTVGSGVAQVPDKIKTTVDFVKGTVSDALKNKIAELKSDISKVVDFVKGSISSGLSSTISSMKSAISKTVNFVKGVLKKGSTTVSSLSKMIGESVSVKVNFVKGVVSTALNKISGLFKEDGGAFYNGVWHNIKQYASGGVPSHGSMFVAGEHGAEMVGHVNGRTEVLNQSQLAAVMKSAVVSAMSVLAGTLINVANTIIANIGLVRGDLNTLANIMNSLSSISIPDIALGKIIPSLITVEIKKENMDEFRAMFDDLKNFLQSNGNRSNINYEFTANINRKTLFDEMITEAKLRQQQTGKNPLTAF